MNRRKFVKQSLAAAGASLLAKGSPANLASAAAGAGATETAPPGKLNIQYIRADIPHFDIPPYKGVRYQDTVPDTLDIAARAEQCIHTLTSITDPNADMEVYWLADFYRNPPILRHDFSDWVETAEQMKQTLPLLRNITGSSLNDHVDPIWMQTLLKEIGPDGLAYVPMQGRPWSFLSLPKSYVTPLWLKDGTSLPELPPDTAQVTHPAYVQQVIPTMTLYYLRDKNPMWKAAIEKMIDRMAALAVNKGDYFYWPQGGLQPFSRYGAGAPMPVGFKGEETNGRMIMGLAQYYRATGYEPARTLAEKLTNYLRFQSAYYEPDGPWLFGDPERQWWTKRWKIENVKHGGHGHAHGIGLVSVLEYATTVGDQETLEFVRGSYEWAKAYGSSLIGWFPEAFVPDYPRCEADTIADMVSMAVKLTLAGAGDYWDDVDRWTRNHLSESQLLDPKWVYTVADRLPPTPVAFNETGDKVAERCVGAFAGWSTANDFYVYEKPDFIHTIQHCCTGTCGRALYYVWENIVQHRQEELRVNLLLNRACEWADIHSHVPYQGKVELSVWKPLRSVLVRMPEWVVRGNQEVKAQANGKTRSFHWEGRYVNLGSAKSGETLTVTFPMPMRKTKATIGAVDYTLELKGNTVVSIDPPGQNGPLYQRSYFKADQAPTRTLVRFVPENPIEW